MHSWPTHSTTTPSRKSSSRRNVPPPPPAYPFVQHGTINALTLLYHPDGRFAWSSLVNHSSPDTPRLLAGAPLPVFPATKPPDVALPRTTVNRQAEQGANFLRTFLPDVDIAEDLIREYVAEDAELANDLKSFDPYIGNTLDIICTYQDESEQAGYLAFPMGELRTELNLSPFSVSSSEGTTVEPSTSSVRTFRTPIRQIVSARSAVIDPPPLAVRTYGSVDVLQVKWDDAVFSVDSLASFTSADHGTRSVVDMQLQPSPFSLLMVNDHGAAYSFDYGQLSLTRLSLDQENGGISVVPSDLFWRIGPGRCPGECLLISSKKAWSIDTRANSRMELFNLSSSNDTLTSVDNAIDHNIVLCSTNELLWIDRRYPCRPLLGYKHYRERDRYLTAQTINLTSPLTFLSSRKNGLISVYDVSSANDHLIHVNSAPYALSPIGHADKLHTGQVFLSQLGKRKGKELGLLRLGELGDISYVELFTQNEEHEPNFQLLKTHAYEALKANIKDLRLDLGPLSEQQGVVVDLSSPYDAIFRAYEKEAIEKEDKITEGVYDLLDLMSDSLRNNDQSTEQILTTYDIAYQAGEESDKGHRTDFFAGSILNSKQGYQAIRRGRLPIEDMVKQAPWHNNITSFLGRIDPEIAGTVEELEEVLKEYNLEEHENRSIESMLYEQRARERLITDLVLSRDIFASHPFASNGEADGILETMTEALSLADDLPAIDFGYLRPTVKETDYYQKKAHDECEERFSVGMRSLLKDWVVGTNADAYVYHDPYQKEDNELPPTQKRQRRPVINTVQSQPPAIVLTQSQKPPAIVASSTTAEIGVKKAIPVQETATQLSDWQKRGNLEPSQEVMMMSTQVLPGPHGGRPGINAKKKGTKKRVGGF